MSPNRISLPRIQPPSANGPIFMRAHPSPPETPCPARRRQRRPDGMHRMSPITLTDPTRKRFTFPPIASGIFLTVMPITTRAMGIEAVPVGLARRSSR